MDKNKDNIVFNMWTEMLERLYYK